MRQGSSLWLTCLLTTSFLAGCGESSPSPTTPSPTTPSPTATTTVAPPESSVASSTSPDDTLLTNSVGIDLKLIPAGTFTMGNDSDPDDGPAHQVTLTKDFYIGVYEVTQKQYEQVVGSNPSHFKGANNPVENVTYEDAVAFCEKLSALPVEEAAGRVYRLPTEGEWEYACRAGTTTAFSFGDDEQDLGKYAWFRVNSESTTHAVGEKLPNDWGLYDMHGNVWEFCSDRVGDYPKGAVTDPVGASTGSYRMFRGSSYDFDAKHCVVTNRDTADPSFGRINTGFRLALSSLSGHSQEADK